MTGLTDAERVARLRRALAPIIDWYVGVLARGEPDSSYLYDSTVNEFDRMHHGIYQEIIEALLPDDVVRAPIQEDEP